MFSLDLVTIIACIAITIAFISAWSYISSTNNENLDSRKKWIEQLPSFVSTLGVLGTFIGITKGLLSFDTSNLNDSIPMLLDGLKTAFFTSLFGMIGSLVLTRVVSRKFDILYVTKPKESKVEEAAALIITYLQNNQKSSNTLREINSQLKQLKADYNKVTGSCIASSFRDIQEKMSTLIDNQNIINNHTQQIADDIEEINGHIQNMDSQLGANTESNNNDIGRLCTVAMTATSSIATMDNNIHEIARIINNIEEQTSDIRENIEAVIVRQEDEIF